MSGFESLLKSLDVTENVSNEDIERTMDLLKLYAPLVCQSARRMDEYTMECYESERKSVADFIDLAIDFDHDNDRKKIAERLSSVGHSMQLLSVLEDALMIVKDDPRHNGNYYKILNARYFRVFNHTIEEACFDAGISESTYYRNIKPAIKFYSGILWGVVIPDYILAAKQKGQRGCRGSQVNMKRDFTITHLSNIIGA